MSYQVTSKSDRWQAVEELYHAALAQPVEQRRAFLAAACADNEELRCEVESLLTQPESRNALFDRDIVAVAAHILGERAAVPGQRIGVYEIVGLLGAGAMGEVYRARDTRLRREVAIKILLRDVANDPDRLARFEREAQVLASLNHPNIATILGVEDAKGTPAIVMELVHGETLAERIASGPLPIAESVAIALQVGDALSAAHELGVIHRDLKPANIKITPTSTVKVLDFGLAKFTRTGATGSDETRLPTITIDRTGERTIVGTAAYMSPEQARGKPVDKRTDMWAFGCVLYEMLTGRLAFGGATVSDVLAKVLEREPDWSALPSATPEAVRRVLRWSLTKEPQRRLRDLADARLVLETSNTGGSDAVVAQPPRARGLAVIAAALVIGSVVVGAFGARWFQSPVPEAARATSRFAIPVGALEVLPRNVAISPDGQYIAYLAGPQANQKTYLRSANDRQSRLIAELPMQAPQPFFSPDSQWVAFFDAGKLKKMPVSGGSPVTVAEAPTPRGGSWGADGSLVFAPISRGGLMWLPATGGPPQVLTTPDQGRGETSHRFPTFLPDFRTVLYVADSSTTAGSSLQAVSIDTKRVSVVSAGDAQLPRYVPTGHLAQIVKGKLIVAPFDVNTLRVTGSPVTLVEGVDSFSFSADGTLIYSEAPPYDIRASTLVWTTREGSVTPLPLPAAVYDHPRLSPDGRTIVLHREDSGDRNLWLYDTARDTLGKFTLTASNDWPVWSADGKRLFYASNRPQTQYDLVSKPVDGSGPEEALLTRPLTQIPRAASPTGDALVYEETYADRPNTLWRMSLGSADEPRPLFGAGAGEMMPTFSPDGRWIGYVSPHTGRNEVYVRSSTGQGGVWQISNAGGVEPVWSFSGRELFYRVDDKMMVVEVMPTPTVSFGKPSVLFEGSYMFGGTEGQEFDVSRDGRRFLMLKPQRVAAATPLNVIVNWFDDLRRRVSASE